PQSCSLAFSLTMEHDGFVSWKNRREGEYFNNKLYTLDLTTHHASRGRLLDVKNHKQMVKAKKRIFTYGPARFANKKARDRFAQLASKLIKLCNKPGVVVATNWATPRVEDPPSPPPRRDNWRRPPPPPRFGRPPPRRH
ncbi:MAG: hypothetical protein OQK35_07765, partial [Alphaproteobacteria bacterium]|nr:hypothetical protein [Alphaproteobacteria bacterium]